MSTITDSQDSIMPDEPQKNDQEDLEGILTDLDAILVDMPDMLTVPAPVPAPAPAPASAPQVNKEPEQRVPPKKEVKQTPKSMTASKTTQMQSPHLWKGIVPFEPGLPSPDPAPPENNIPAETAKEQIRSIAVIYAASVSKEKDECIAFLAQTARTISKKPFYLRWVLVQRLTAGSDVWALITRLQPLGAVAVVAVVDGSLEAKAREVKDVCAQTGLLFHAIAAVDAQKKSTAVDIIVDIMMLPYDP